MTTFIRVKGLKVSSALSTEQLEVALWQNSYLNFWTLYPNEGRTFTLTENLKIQTGGVSTWNPPGAK